MPADLRRFLGVACALALVACPTEGGPSPTPNVVVLEPGSGAPNDESLWPLHPGFMTIDGIFPLGNRRTIARATTIASRPAVAFGQAPDVVVGRSDDRTVARTAVYEVTEAGVVLSWAPGVGELDPPLLLVPAEVRDGMVWRSTAGGVAYRMTCTLDSARVSARRVWTITIEDPSGRTANGTTFEWTAGDRVSIQFVEGLGPMAGTVLPRADVLSGFPHTIVAPLEGGVAPAPLARLPVEDVLEIEDLWRPHLYLPQWLDVTAGSETTVHVATIGMATGFMTLPPWRPQRETTCGILDLAAATYTNDECVSAPAVLIEDDGDRASFRALVSRTALEVAPPGRLQEVAGLYERGDGAIGVLVRDLGGQIPRGGPSDLYAGRFDPTGGDNAGVDLVALSNPLLHLNDHAHGVIVSARHPDGAALFTLGGDGPSVFLFLGDDDVVTDRHVALGDQGRLSVHSRPGEREILRVSSRGVVERVVLDRHGVVLEPLGQLELGPDELAWGAFTHGERLYAFVQRGVRGYVAQYEEGGFFDPSTQPDLGTAVLVSTPLPTAGPRQDPSIVESLIVERHEDDAVLCVRPDVTLDTAGWTVGGTAAVLIRDAHTGCYGVIRTGGAPYFVDDRTIEGPLPGLGRVRILTGETASPATTYRSVIDDDVLTAVPGGGLVSMRANRTDSERWVHHVGAGAMRSTFLERPAAREMVSDPFGHALWSLTTDDDLVFIAVRHGTTSTRPAPEFRIPMSARYAASLVPGGGVVIDGELLREDGSRAPVVLPPDLEAWEAAWAVFEPNAVCVGLGCFVDGVLALDLAAVEPALLDPSAVAALPAAFGTDAVVHHVERDGATLGVVVRYDGAGFDAERLLGPGGALDLEALGLDLDAPTALSFSLSSDGVGYVLADVDLGGPHELVMIELAAAGPRIVDLPKLGVARDRPGRLLAVDDDLFYVAVGTGETAEALRIPR